MRPILVLLILFMTGSASARDELGRLSLILAPNNAQPALFQQGGSIQAVLTKNVPLRIESAAGEVALEFQAARPWRGHWIVTTRIPTATPPGVYTLVAEGPEGRDSAFRAVYVLPERPESYRIAHVSNLRVGDPQRPDTRLFRLTDELNDGNPDLILVTGDLTAAGKAEQFHLALDVLNDCQAPTVVAPGAADDAEGLREAYLGELPTAVPYGPDGFLICSPRSGARPGVEARLHLERRAIRAARWSMGAMAEISDRDLRTALTVFVDDPLDYVFEATGQGATDSEIGWGRTRAFAGPADGEIQWFTVSPRGVVRADNASE